MTRSLSYPIHVILKKLHTHLKNKTTKSNVYLPLKACLKNQTVYSLAGTNISYVKEFG